jgi:hypothetical protein
MGWAWHGVLVDLAQGQDMWGLGWGFRWVRGQFHSESRHVGLGMEIWLSEG